MVRRVAGKSLPVTYIRIKSLGRLNYGQNRSGQLITAPHVKRGKPKSAVTAQQNAEFTRFVQALKDMNVYDQVGARDIAFDSAYMFRDVLSRALVGRLIVWGEPVSDDIQTQLDSITAKIGSMLLRTSDGWVGLFSNTADDVLTIDDVTHLPTWKAPGTSSGGLYGPLLLGPVPTQANTGFTAWANQPVGSTVTPILQGFTVTQPVQGSNYRPAWLSKVAPTPPYTITILMMHAGTHANFGSVQFGWWNGATTGLLGQCIHHSLNDGLGIINFSGFNPSTVSVPSGSISIQTGWPDVLWLRMRDPGDGTVKLYASQDGENFATLMDRAKAGSGGLGATGYGHIVFGASSYSLPAWGSLIQYKETSP